MLNSPKYFTRKKRFNSSSIKDSENNVPKEYIIGKGNSKFYLKLSLEQEINKILIKCGQSKDSYKFELNLKMEALKQKCRIFHACYTLEEAFKIISNLFKNKKAVIKTEPNDTVILVLTLMNFIEDTEEEVEFKMNKIKIASHNESTENNSKNDINDIFQENKSHKGGNKENNLYLSFEQKLKTLYRNIQAKDNQIARLEKNFEEIKIFHSLLQKEENNIKNSIGFNPPKLKEENFSDVEENKELEDEEQKKEEDNKEEKNEEEIQDDTKINNSNLKESVKKSSKKKSKSKSKASKVKVIKVKELKNCLSKEDMKMKNLPKMEFVKNLGKKAICKFLGDNNFAVFKTINNEILLSYGTPYNSIHFYNIELESVTKRITDAHQHEITNFRYAYDQVKNRDLLLTISNMNKNIKIWNIDTLDCIVNITNAYNSGDLFSACFLIDHIQSKNYIISINHDKENLKVFDFSGKKISEINNSEDKSFLVDSYYSIKTKKFYIIVGNEKFIVSYNFPEGTIFHKYCENNSNSWHMNFLISTKEKEVNLIESDTMGYIRIWDFINGELLKKLFIEKKMRLRAICLLNYKYLFVGAEDKKIKLIDLENNIEIDNLKVNDIICTIKTINCPKYGNCLIFIGKIDSGQIKLWKNANYK